MIDLRMVFHYYVQKPALIPKVLSQNFTDKSCLFKVKNMQSGSSSDPCRIHEAWRRRFTYLHHIMRKGKAKLCTYTKTHFHHLPSVGTLTNYVSNLAHLVCTVVPI